MTKLTSVILLIIFTVSLIVGITIGITVNQAQTTPTLIEWTAPSPNYSIGTLLVLGVNNFTDEEIYLESAWRVTINQSQSGGENYIDVILVGIYPSAALQSSQSAESEYLQAHDPIVFPKAYLSNLNAYQLLNTIPALHQSDNYFQDVIVLDEYAINHLIALTNPNPQLPVAAPPENAFIHPWDDPQRAYELQHNILEALCAPPHHLISYDNFILGFTIIPTHLKTTLTNSQIVEAWQSKANLVPLPTIDCSIY